MAAGPPDTIPEGNGGGGKKGKKEFSLCVSSHHMPGIRGPELGEGG